MSGETIGIIVTAVVGPLLAYLIKRYWENIAAQAEAKRRKAEEDAQALKNDQAQSKGTGDVNSQIDAQKKAREEWERTHPNGS